LIDPRNGVDARLDLRARDGIVVEIGEHLRPQAGESVIDASGAYIAPGFIDMHVHLREPGNPEKETFETGLAAAAAGGFTAVAAMPNTNPAIDTAELVREVRERASAIGSCRMYPIGAITQGRRGTSINDYAALRGAGVVALSDDGNTVMDAAVMLAAARSARGSDDLPLVVHCEDEWMKQGTCMTDGPTAHALGVRGVSALSEDTIVARDVLICSQAECALHVAHLSTGTSAGIVRWARSVRRDGERVRVTCEVTPHHLVFTEGDVERLGGYGKVNPPLRFEQDVRALRDAVRDGTIDAFASDHAPHTEQEKGGSLMDACVGFSGMEIAVGAYAYALPDLPLRRFVELLSCNPATILRIPGGKLSVGDPADITIFADREWTVDPRQFKSKGRATPFAGTKLPRKVVATIVGGRIVYREPSYA
jgi:dihydroorotase